MPAKLSPMDALDYLPQPLIIITAGDFENSKQRGGMTAAWVSRVSWNPPLVMVSIAPSRYTLELVEAYKEFAVNIVGERLEEVAYGIFGSKSGKYIDKFSESKVKTKKGEKIKAPILEDAIVVLECKLTKTCEAGDHILVIGEVVSATKFNNEDPIVFVYGNSAKIKR
jgi:flavin reductase (DIM6/NTAB) family NADH-FMN oxidoreductase RutF